MKSFRSIIIACCCIISYTKLQAQEISLSINPGFSGLNYNINNGSNKIDLGYRLGLGYTFFLNNNWAILSAAEYSFFSNSSTLNDGTHISYQIDSDMDVFEYRVKTRNYKEYSKFSTISIPLMLQYHTSKNIQFFINGGARVYLPFKHIIKTNATEITTTGFYDNVNLELYDMPQHGFSTLIDWKNQNQNKLNTTIALSLESGIKFNLNSNYKLYLGVYLDYGLNNLKKINDPTHNHTSIINYSSGGINYISSNNLLYTKNEVNKANLLAYGIHLKIGLNTNNKDNNIKLNSDVIEKQNNKTPVENLIENIKNKDEIKLSEEEPIEIYEESDIEKVIKAINKERINFIEKQNNKTSYDKEIEDEIKSKNIERMKFIKDNYHKNK